MDAKEVDDLIENAWTLNAPFVFLLGIFIAIILVIVTQATQNNRVY